MSKKSSKTKHVDKPCFRACVPPCPRYITSGDTHALCVVCLGAGHAASALERADCPHCDLLPMRTLRSRKALFEEGAFTSVPRRRSGPFRTGSAVRLSSSKGGESVQYEELLEVVTHAVEKLKIDWPAKSQAEPQRSRLDERFLHLPFFPDLHTEVSRLWNSPFSACLFIPVSYNYGSVAGLDERSYRAMPQVEQTLASYLSPGSASSLKAPALPTKPLRVTSALVGKGYTAAGQAGACLHTMSVLQAYQADLLKELDEGEEIKDSDIAEVRRTADLALRATKETAHAIGRSMAALVAAERHLWLTLSDMKEKDRVFLLDAPLSPFGLFGNSVNSVVDRYQEARKQAAAFQRFLPLRHPAREAAGREQPRPSTSSSYRDAQKQSVATRTQPHRERVVVRSKPDLRSSTKRSCQFRRGAPHSLVSASPLCPQETVLLTLPVLQGAAASSEHTPRGAGELATPEGVSGAASSGASCRGTVTGHRSSGSTNTRDYRSFGSVETTGQCVCLPFVGVSPTLVGPEQGLVMEQEVVSLLRKEAIEVVSPHDRESGFYSRYFIVPKKDGGLPEVVSQIRSEDWFVTIDLKDAYFHVSILPQHRKFLRFAFRGEAYQYRVLPFGLALSPHTFTKCVDAALAPLRLQGIRILNYFDDWLILAQSEQLAAQHRDVVLAHMKELGLRLNAKKSVLSPLQRTTYLGVVWDSTTMQARLSPARIESILAAVRRVKVGRSLTVKHFQQLLGLMAAASNVIPFGLLYMRPLQWWLKTRGFSPRGNPLRMIKVTRQCLRALDMSRNPWFLSQGPVLGAPCRRVTLATDASLTGWGAVMSGHTARGLWRGHQLTWHINCLEMLAVFQALKHFLPDRNVLVRTDNTTVVSYINHQGGLRSRPLYKLVHQILVWSRGKLLSLRAVYLPGYLNVGADILSRQGPRPGNGCFTPSVWSSTSGPFCHEGEHAISSSSPGAGCHGTDVAEASSVRFSPDRSAPGSSRESAPGRGVPSSSSPVLAGPSLVLGPDFFPRRLSMGDSRQEGSPLTGGGHCVPPSPGAVETLGVAPEGAHLLASSLSTKVVETILQSRGGPVSLYEETLCLEQDPVNCPVGTVLEFLQDRLSAGLSHSTLKVYVAAIAAYHAPLCGLSMGKDPLVSHFLRGALRLRPPVRSRVPSWDLPPFEPIEEISDRHLTIKTVLLIAITSLKRGLAKAFLHPRSGYIPKVPSSAPRPVVLQAFCPPPFREPDQQKLNCPRPLL
ncbi:hypothetical protein M9458_044742, partial [Cirrhinus mrigala]